MKKISILFLLFIFPLWASQENFNPLLDQLKSPIQKGLLSISLPWVEHFPEIHQQKLEAINKNFKRTLIPQPNPETDYGYNFGIVPSNQEVLGFISTQAKNRSFQNPFTVYTYGCGSEGLFEFNALCSGLSVKDSPKVIISMSDSQKSVIMEASKNVAERLKTLRNIPGLNVPAAKELYRTSISSLPNSMDGKNYPDGQADMVYTHAVAHFLKEEELQHFFQNSYKKLKNLGYLIITAQAPSQQKLLVDFYFDHLSKGDTYPGFVNRKAITVMLHQPDGSIVKVAPNSIIFRGVDKAKENDYPGKCITYRNINDKLTKIGDHYLLPYFYESDKEIDKQLKDNIMPENFEYFLKLHNSGNAKIYLDVLQVTQVFLDVSILESLAQKTGFSILDSKYFTGYESPIDPKLVTPENLSKKLYSSHIVLQKK